MPLHPAHHAMLKALERNRGKHLDVSVLAGHPNQGVGLPVHGHDGTDGGYADDDCDEAEELGLAPDGTPLGEDGDERDEAMGHAAHLKEGVPPGEEMIYHPGEKDFNEAMQETLANSHLGRGSMAHKAKMKNSKGAEKPVGNGGGHPLSSNKV